LSCRKIIYKIKKNIQKDSYRIWWFWWSKESSNERNRNSRSLWSRNIYFICWKNSRICFM